MGELHATSVAADTMSKMCALPIKGCLEMLYEQGADLEGHGFEII